MKVRYKMEKKNKVWKNEIVNVDSREKISPTILELFFTLDITTLEVGDIKYENKLIEVKIAADVHDYSRLREELYRMSLTDFENHAIYVGSSLKEYKIFIGLCQKYGIYGHSIQNLMDLGHVCKKIFRGHYSDSVPFIQKPSSTLNAFQRQLCALNGITESMALECPFHSWSQMVFNVNESEILLPFNNWFGVNKDGSSKKITMDFIHYLLTGDWRYGRKNKN